MVNMYSLAKSRVETPEDPISNSWDHDLRHVRHGRWDRDVRHGPKVSTGDVMMITAEMPGGMWIPSGYGHISGY